MMKIGLDKAVAERIESIKKQVQSRATRSCVVLRNSAKTVLSGKRQGNLTKKPHVQRRYRASAPGEPPAVRSGTLRRSWRETIEINQDGMRIGIESDVPYAPYLEEGTSKMAARPYADKIVEDAQPKIEAIFSEPYH